MQKLGYWNEKQLSNWFNRWTITDNIKIQVTEVCPVHLYRRISLKVDFVYPVTGEWVWLWVTEWVSESNSNWAMQWHSHWQWNSLVCPVQAPMPLGHSVNQILWMIKCYLSFVNFTLQSLPYCVKRAVCMPNSSHIWSKFTGVWFMSWLSFICDSDIMILPISNRECCHSLPLCLALPASCPPSLSPSCPFSLSPFLPLPLLHSLAPSFTLLIPLMGHPFNHVAMLHTELAGAPAQFGWPGPVSSHYELAMFPTIIWLAR